MAISSRSPSPPDGARLLSKADELRVLAGLAVQPFVAALLALVTFPLTEYTGRLVYGGRPVDPVRSAIAFAIGVGIVGLATTVLGALPALGWALKRGRLRDDGCSSRERSSATPRQRSLSAAWRSASSVPARRPRSTR